MTSLNVMYLQLPWNHILIKKGEGVGPLPS